MSFVFFGIAWCWWSISCFFTVHEHNDRYISKQNALSSRYGMFAYPARLYRLQRTVFRENRVWRLLFGQQRTARIALTRPPLKQIISAKKYLVSKMRHEILFSGYFLILQSFKRVCIFPGKAAAMFKASKNVRASILKNVMKRIISTARNPAK